MNWLKNFDGKKKVFYKLLHIFVVGHNKDNISSITIMKNILKGRDQKKLIQILMGESKALQGGKNATNHDRIMGLFNELLSLILLSSSGSILAKAFELQLFFFPTCFNNQITWNPFRIILFLGDVWNSCVL